MSLVTLHENNFDVAVSGTGILLVDCWAGWCGACKVFKPVYEKLAGKHPGITFGSLDIGTEKRLMSRLGIEHIPTLLLYRDGILLFQQAGYYEEEEMEDILQQAETVDMDLVRAELDAETTEAVESTTNKEDSNE